ncbi:MULTISPECIES: OsmC family protein [Phenylobacterium]|jgi:putative redox protein|uniref:OsmC family protein n=1 Tax=Phenylobacterium conjunctum TaxID=1298959 RepID=A0ABW3T1U3_9CAUL
MSQSVAHERIAEVGETGQGKFLNAVRIGPHRMLADEPVSVGGDGLGPDPYEFVLAGLGACTSMTIRMYAERKGWPLLRVAVRVRHAERMAAGAPKDVFERVIHLEGDLSQEERDRLMDIAERCPVSRTLSAGSTVTSRLADDPPPGEGAG